MSANGSMPLDDDVPELGRAVLAQMTADMPNTHRLTVVYELSGPAQLLAPDTNR